MTAANGLAEGEQMLVIAPFEPAPLFGVLAKKGFGHSSRQTPSGDWEVLFTREAGATPADSRATVRSADICVGAPMTTPTGRQECRRSLAPGTVEVVDARGLEPPQPMVLILETLAALPAGASLRAMTDRRPIHLYPILEERGFTAETEEQSNDTFITHIRRN
jgi:uncharacterized protein (DUF2249 family)